MNIIKLINKRWKEHKEERDGDGFACCPVIQQLKTRVATKREWLGTEESRQKAFKDKKIMDKYTKCDFCSLCSELIGILNERKKELFDEWLCGVYLGLELANKKLNGCGFEIKVPSKEKILKMYALKHTSRVKRGE